MIAESVIGNCPKCYARLSMRLQHYEVFRCACRAVLWTLRPERYGSLEIFQHPGTPEGDHWIAPAEGKLCAPAGPLLLTKGTPIEVTLEECARAEQVGRSRRDQSRAQGFTQRRGIDGSNEANCLRLDIIGALGELAFAKGAGLEWPASVNAPKHAPDVLPDWQVKTTDRRSGKLIVRRDDNSAHKFALMISLSDTLLTFGGWMLAGEAMTHQDCWEDLNNGREKVFAIPQSLLYG
jgi:hypothetical protein